jgi:hypothetical protein
LSISMAVHTMIRCKIMEKKQIAPKGAWIDTISISIQVGSLRCFACSVAANHCVFWAGVSCV